MGLQECRDGGLELLSRQFVAAALEDVGATPDGPRIYLDDIVGFTLALQAAQPGGVDWVKPGLLDRIHGDILQQGCRDCRDRPKVGRLGEYRGSPHLLR